MSEKTINEAIKDLKVMICNYASSVGGREDFDKNDFDILKAMLSDFERLSKESCIENVAKALYEESHDDNGSMFKSDLSYDIQSKTTKDYYRKKAESVLSKTE